MNEKNTFSEIMFLDYSGILRNKTIREPVGNRVSFDASSININVGIEYSDMCLIPDNDSTIHLGGRRIYMGEMDSPLSPRNLLKRLLARFKEKGFGFKIGIEPEFYLTKEGNVLDRGTYLKGSDHNFTKVLLSALDKCNLKPMMAHHEVGPGQYEFGYEGDEPIKIADSLAFFKTIVKHVATDMGFEASFMPKPFINEAGNGMHVHISVWELGGDKEENLFLKDEAKMRHFIGGLVKHAREISALTSPSVNSYKRLGASEAPAYTTWGHRNRSALVRVPQDKNRVEFRATDCSVNPYLAFVAIITAGMDGIENQIEPTEELKISSYALGPSAQHLRLPFDLTEALLEFRQSQFMRKVLPPEIFANYLRVKEKEIKQYMNQVTEREHQMYSHV